MRIALCSACVAYMAVIAAALPAAAQQDAASQASPKHTVRIRPPVPGPSGQGTYRGYCGDWFRCYTGIPLRCGDNTRPYQDIANHACFCVHDGCPQQ